MSDQDDLKRLEEQLRSGRITEQEYASEKAWILGEAASEQASAAASRPASASHTPSGNHVLDLHEIEEAAAAADISGTSKATADRYADRHTKSRETRRRIPTVWKVILIAFLVWILLLATAVVYLRIRNMNSTSAATSQHSSTGAQIQGGSIAAQTAAQELQDNAADASYEAFVAQLESTLSTYYGSNYSITDDGKTLTISLMGDGIAADAMYVVQGADGAAEIWSELKASMQTLAVTCFDGANAEAAERHVVLNILNDQNQENVILSYLDGTCIYDATETADLSK